VVQVIRFVVWLVNGRELLATWTSSHREGLEPKKRKEHDLLIQLHDFTGERLSR